MIGSIISALWLVLPAYVPNSSAVLFQGQTPIDFGKNFIDGKRVLGDGKTIKGFIGGSLTGIAIGVIQIFLSEKIGLSSFDKNIWIIMSLSIGSMVGDGLFSFIKRRIGLKRGYPFPLFDQLDFLIGALFLTRLLHKKWFYENFTINYLLIIFILTPIIHLFINYVGYKLGKKEEPW